MKLLKVLTIAMVAGLLMSSAVAVSSASAAPTVFCEVNETPCTEKNTYSEKWTTLYTGETGGFVKLTMPSLGSVTCGEEKFMNNTMESSKAGPLVGTLEDVVPVNTCGTKCVLEVSNLPAAEIEASGKKDGNGTLRVKEPIFMATCTTGPPVFKCFYTAAKIELSLKGGEKPTASGTGALTRTSGAGATINCPLSATVEESGLKFGAPARENLYITTG